MPKYGDPALREQFWRRVTVTSDGCWQWTGFIGSYGYGYISWAPSADESQRAHRTAYLALVGPIPEGLVLDHLCRNRSCVNPSHLEPVTVRENVLRGVGVAAVRAVATTCESGHALSGDNLYVTPDQRRQCRECRAAASRAWRARQKAVCSVA